MQNKKWYKKRLFKYFIIGFVIGIIFSTIGYLLGAYCPLSFGCFQNCESTFICSNFLSELLRGGYLLFSWSLIPALLEKTNIWNSSMQFALTTEIISFISISLIFGLIGLCIGWITNIIRKKTS